MTDDLKDALTRTLAERPPLMPAAEMLAHARSADRRRTGYLAAGGSGVVAVAVAAVAIAVPNLHGSGGTRVGSPPRTPSSVSASASASATEAAPTGRAAVPMAHGKQLTTALLDRLPTAYTSRPLVNYAEAPSTIEPGRNDGNPPYLINATSVIQIFTADREGMLTAYVARDKQPDPSGDLCAAQVAARLGFGALTCEVRTVGAVQVRVTTATYPYSGAATSATIFLGDGWITVTEHLGSLFPTALEADLPPDGDPRRMAANDGGDGQRLPALTTPPFTPQQLAEACAALAALAPN